jgi:hypothetical protein
MGYETLRVFRFMKSIRINCPRVIVFVKYAFPGRSPPPSSRNPPGSGPGQHERVDHDPAAPAVGHFAEGFLQDVGSSPIEFT